MRSILRILTSFCFAASILLIFFSSYLVSPILDPAVARDAIADASNKANSPSSASNAARQINAQGKLLPARGIARLSGLPGDRVESILVKPGETIVKDQPIAILKSDSIKKIELEAAELKLEEAKTTLRIKKRELDLGVSLANSRVVAAEMSIELAKKQLEMAKQSEKQLPLLRRQIETLRQLRNDPLTKAVVGRIELESREIEYEKANATAEQSILAAASSLRQSEIQWEQSKQSLHAAELSRSAVEENSPVAPLEKQIELLKVQLAESTLRAPYDATVVNILTEVGERITTLPIAEIADLSKMVCVAEVFEADVGRIQIGDTAKLKSSALNLDLEGKVIRIDRVVGGSQLRSPNPMARTDFRSVGVWIELDSNNSKLASDRLQLQVDVMITTSPK
ncbi:MAG: HlyD family efflux transporter periplasmic adaptor subunit [Pirellula sp.]|jgi:HlyD family secretion protein|nr:HlyD family efflux transporter periplasmic adaptor subunit [Pirellula sp.]